VLLLVKPIIAIYAQVFFLLWPTDTNVIKQFDKLDGKKDNAVCKHMSVPALKKIAKQHNVTINDVVLSIVSSSLRQYLERRNDKNLDAINLLMPFSTRALPKSISEHQLENDFNVISFTLPMAATHTETISRISKATKALKKSIYPFAVKALTEIIAWFPGIIGQLVMMWVVSKATVVLSNVPGPKAPLKFGKYNSRALVGLIPGLGDLAVGISALSHVDDLIMAIQSDTSQIKDVRELRTLCEQNYDELVRNHEASTKQN
jgi:diacylglycerol O-acyltransferase / wax synthase